MMPGLAMAARLARRARKTSRSSTPFLVITAAERSDLEFAQLEAALVQAHTGARILVGAEARRDKVLTHLASARLVHIAGHAEADVSVPWRSKLVLADGDLTAAELMSGAARLDEVILSGCETGYTEAARAPQERAGLTGALLANGCSTIVSTWWPVYDLTSCIVSTEIHRIVREERLTTAEALRRVQSWLRSATREDLLLWCNAQERHLPPSTLAGREGRRILRSARDELLTYDAQSPPFGSVLDWAGFYVVQSAPPAN
jgi:CHAT domain-containing protein